MNALATSFRNYNALIRPIRVLNISICNASSSSTGSEHKDAPTKPLKPSESPGPALALSSCTENTVLFGANYLKDQPPVLAMPDDQYPPWLWNLLKPRVYDESPGGQGEKVRLRKENRQRIKEQNFMKTQ